jgi:hypothetical protein
MWFTTYVVTWMILITIFATDQPMWVCILSSVLALGFVGFTDPAPRVPATVRAGCGCFRCEDMRARHNRRRTDVKDAG